MNEFTIWQKLPSLNEIINTNRNNKFAGAREKKQLQADVGWAIKLAIREGTLHKVENPVSITFEYYEKNKRRDIDNIGSASKYVLDSLVEHEIIKDDNVQYVKEIHYVLKSTNALDYKVRVILEELKSVEY